MGGEGGEGEAAGAREAAGEKGPLPPGPVSDHSPRGDGKPWEPHGFQAPPSPSLVGFDISALLWS